MDDAKRAREVRWAGASAMEPGRRARGLSPPIRSACSRLLPKMALIVAPQLAGSLVPCAPPPARRPLIAASGPGPAADTMIIWRDRWLRSPPPNCVPRSALGSTRLNVPQALAKHDSRERPVLEGRWETPRSRSMTRLNTREARCLHLCRVMPGISLSGCVVPTWTGNQQLDSLGQLDPAFGQGCLLRGLIDSRNSAARRRRSQAGKERVTS